jgi:hypothetical protein
MKDDWGRLIANHVAREFRQSTRDREEIYFRRSFIRWSVPENEGNNQFRILIPGGEMLPVTDADPEGLSLKNSNNMRQGSQELELKGSPWAARFTAIARS